MNSTKFIQTALAAAIVVAAAAALAGCSKKGSGKLTGNYSFKTSGFVYAVRDSSDMVDTSYVARYDETNEKWVNDTVLVNTPDSTTISITTESGQMDITPMGGGRDLVTMNCTGGDLVVYYANEENGVLVLEPAVRKANVGAGGTITGSDDDVTISDTSIQADIIVDGRGTKYENILLFILNYSGTYKYNGHLYRIYDSSVNCRAKENED